MPKLVKIELNINNNYTQNSIHYLEFGFVKNNASKNNQDL